MMKFWLEFLTPKHLLFLYVLAKKIQEKGHKVLFTTRMHREVMGLMKLKKIDAKIIGKYGATKKEKLVYSIERMQELVDVVSSLDPDVAISFSSPDAARIAFGLGIPHYTANDSPHAIHSAKLTIPLSELLFSSWVIPREVWLRYGIDYNRIINYHAIDQAAWIKSFVPDRTIIKNLGIDLGRKIVLIRESEVYASYLLGKTESLAPVSDSLLQDLLKSIDAYFVILPRYERQIEYLEKKYRYDNVIIVKRVVEATNLIYFSDLLIGGGGTMTGEAALLGVPTISFFPRDDLYVINYLIQEGLVFKERKKDWIISLAIKLLNDDEWRESIKEKARFILNSMEDPTDKILNTILSRHS